MVDRPGLIESVAEAAALAAARGIPVAIWFGARRLPRLAREGHAGIAALVTALGPILLAGLGVAAAMVLFLTHVEDVWSGGDYLLAGLSLFVPLLIWPAALIAWGRGFRT